MTRAVEEKPVQLCLCAKPVERTILPGEILEAPWPLMNDLLGGENKLTIGVQWNPVNTVTNGPKKICPF